MQAVLKLAVLLLLSFAITAQSEDTCEPCYIVDETMYAGQDIFVGDITYTYHPDTNAYEIQIMLEGGWYLEKVDIYIGKTALPHNPPPGQFPYKYASVNNAYFGVTIPISTQNIPCTSDSVYIAVHADVNHPSESGETAWAHGNIVFTGRWGWQQKYGNCCERQDDQWDNNWTWPAEWPQFYPPGSWPVGYWTSENWSTNASWYDDNEWYWYWRFYWIEYLCSEGCVIDSECPTGNECQIPRCVNSECVFENNDDYVLEGGMCGTGACASPGRTICVNEEPFFDCEEGEPALEECDGIDNDCDGQIDENFNCDDNVACTVDTCAGFDGCQHEASNCGECFDCDLEFHQLISKTTKENVGEVSFRYTGDYIFYADAAEGFEFLEVHIYVSHDRPPLNNDGVPVYQSFPFHYYELSGNSFQRVVSVDSQCSDDMYVVFHAVVTNDESVHAYAGTIVSAASVSAATNDNCGRYGDGHAIVADTIGKLVFSQNPPPEFVQHPDGTAHIRGRAVRVSDNVAFNVVALLSGYRDSSEGPKKELKPECYSENGGQVDTDTWEYYLYATGTLTAVSGSRYEGAVLSFVRKGPAAQVGAGANGKNQGLGVSFWFSYTRQSQSTTQYSLPANGGGDFNLDKSVSSNAWGFFSLFSGCCDSLATCPECYVDSQCSDTYACTTESCVNDMCQVVLRDEVCSDDYRCTSDRCIGNGGDARGCVNTANHTRCNDGVPCTSDECIGDGGNTDGCKNTPNHNLCADAHACTVNECVGSTGDANGCGITSYDDNDCVDGYACTDDECTANGCTNTPNDGNCSDDWSCTNNFCVGADGDERGCSATYDDNDCNDNISCTSDSCVGGEQGCVNTPDDTVCGEDNECTTYTCDVENGGCQVVTDASVCGDNIDCTIDTCDEVNGCVNTPSDAACDDGNICTTDTCTAEGCSNDLINTSCNPAEGTYLNPTTCECEAICGDGIIADGYETCEPDQVEDASCCVECQLVEVPCDDGVICTFDDRCLNGVCQGVEAIDFEMTQNREAFPVGAFTPGQWTRWGVTVNYNSEDVTLSVVDTSATDRSEFQFPSGNANGGSFEHGNILVVDGGDSSVCFSFSNPFDVEGVSLVSVSRPDTTVSFKCVQQSGTKVRTVQTVQYGAGTTQYIESPCAATVSEICFDKMSTSGVAGIYTCPPNYPTGGIGDYVWHDFDIDALQDAFEVGIQGVTVVLLQDGNELASTTTNSEGFYLFDNLWAGEYDVEFYAISGFQFSSQVDPIGENPEDGAIRNISLGEGEHNLDIDVGLFLHGSIGDFVFVDDNQNGLQDEGAGVADVTMELFFADDTDTPFRTTTTDENGLYNFVNLPVFRTVDSFAKYIVKVIPPEFAVISPRFAGNDVTIDSNFHPSTHLSNVVELTVDTRHNPTIDCGIFFTGGSIGDYVFVDSNENGIQDQTGDAPKSGVVVHLHRNNVAVGTTSTDDNGLYLFENLPLSGTYKVSFERPFGFVFTVRYAGGDNELDSDVDANGWSGSVVLTRDEPHVRSVDAGIYEGCVTESECLDANACETAQCLAFTCVYVQTVICEASQDPCFDSICNAESGECELVPTMESRPCNDDDPCTVGDTCNPNGSCSGTPTTDNNVSCNDGDTCTENDLCVPGTGECEGEPIRCEQSENVCQENVCVDGSCEIRNVPGFCSDNNLCTLSDTCVEGVCQGTPTDCSHLDDQCVVGTCDLATGQCLPAAAFGGESCDDGNSCTSGDSCEEGVCSGDTIICTPPTQCHNSHCSFGECVDEFVGGRRCDDGNPCTENDVCDTQSQACVGVEIVCGDDNPCTLDVCVGGICEYPADVDATCDDGDLCTESYCTDGQCFHEAPMECNDDNDCTIDYCEGGSCVHDPVSDFLTCDDGNICTSGDVCIGGTCNSGAQVDCDDNNVCTNDVCVPGEGCVITNNSDPCDDGDACTMNVCSEGGCIEVDTVDCSDFVVGPCEVAICNSQTGQCQAHVVQDNTACDDGNSCTENDFCDAGVCAGTPMVCESDGNPCTLEFCLDGACVQEDVDYTLSCTDNDPCTVDEFCFQGECVGFPMDCNDENHCTTDTCEDGVCVYENNTNPCNDGDDCTLGDRCEGGECKGTPMTCTPLNFCYDAHCELGACIQTENENPCDDNNACTETDVCTLGECQGTLVDCTPGICEVASCDPVTGECIIEPTPNVPCDDGNLCTVGDTCLGNVCVGRERTCSSPNPEVDDQCFSAVCEPETGLCVNTNISGECDDGDACTPSSTCVEGVCTGHDRLVCETETVCTQATCDAETGRCVETIIDFFSLCDDGDDCTNDDTCYNGSCFGTPLDCSELDDDCGRGVCANGNCARITAEFENERCFGTFENGEIREGVCGHGVCIYSIIIVGDLDEESEIVDIDRQDVSSSEAGAVGVTQNLVFTGESGTISTVVIGGIGAATVGAFAIFAVVIGLNNTKEDKAVPLGAVLQESEMQMAAQDNPLLNVGENMFINVDHQ